MHVALLSIQQFLVSVVARMEPKLRLRASSRAVAECMAVVLRSMSGAVLGLHRLQGQAASAAPNPVQPIALYHRATPGRAHFCCGTEIFGDSLSLLLNDRLLLLDPMSLHAAKLPQPRA